ncbi:hypothetical protein MASR2M70_02730 [Bacillota bacterium]
MIADYNHYILSRREKLGFCLGAGSLFAGASFLFYDSLFVSGIFSTLAYPALRIYSKFLAEKRKAELLCQFRDLLYSLSSSIAAGRQMREALFEAEEGMKTMYGADALICRELTNMVINMEESGETEEYVLEYFAIRSRIPDIIRFADIYGISKSTGADIQRVIYKTVGILLDRIELDEEIRSLTAEKRLEFAILTAMPLLTLIFLRLSSPSYLSIMYECLAGRLLMTAAFMAMSAAAYFAFRITRIKL